MEIIFLILLAMDGEQLADLEMHNHMKLPKWRPGQTCEAYLETEAARSYILARNRPGQQVRATCAGGSKLAQLEELVKSSASWKVFGGTKAKDAKAPAGK